MSRDEHFRRLVRQAYLLACTLEHHALDYRDPVTMQALIDRAWRRYRRRVVAAREVRG